MKRITRPMVVKALGITVLALALSLVIAQPVGFSVFSLFTAPHRDEVTLNDFYAQIADERPVRTIEKDIVIVNIENQDRYQIAAILNEISAAKPAVIGLDVIFPDPRSEEDTLLINAIERAGKIVLAEKLIDAEDESRNAELPIFDYDEVDFFHGTLANKSVSYAFANFVNEKEGGVIREFCPQLKMKDGNEFLSFATAIAKDYNPKAVEKMMERGRATEIISYPSKYFEVIQPEEIEANRALLKDKIVLVGDMHSAYDMHATPISHYQPGIMVHAYILSTILSGTYYREVSNLITWAIAFFLCFLVILTAVYSGLMLKGLVVRFLQVIFVVGAVMIGFSLYIHQHIILNFTFVLLMVTFGLFAADIWNGVVDIHTQIKKRRERE